MIAGTLEIQMLANMARLQADMDTAKRSVSGAMDSIEKSVGAAKQALGALGIGLSVGYFVSLIKGSIDAADHLNDLSKSTNIVVGDLAGLRLLARQSGTDLDGLAKAINKMSVEMGKDPEKFKALGITAKDNVGALKQFADIFNLLPDINQRNALAQAVFSKSWAELAPVLAEGGKKIGEIIEKGKRLSGTTDGLTKAADEFNDKWAQLTGTGGLLTRQIAPLLPLLNALADDMLKAGEETGGVSSSFNVLAETLRPMIILMGNFAYVWRTVGIAAAGTWEQMQGLKNGGIEGFLKSRALVEKILAAERADFDAWEKKMLAVGTTAKATTPAVVALTEAEKAAQKAATARAAEFLETQKKQKDAYEAIQKKAADYVKGLEKETAQLGLNAGQKKMIEAAAVAVTLKTEAERQVVMKVAAAWVQKAEALEQATAAARENNRVFDIALAAQELEEAAINSGIRSIQDKVEALNEETFSLTATAKQMREHIVLLALQKSGLDKATDAYAEMDARLRAAMSANEMAREAKAATDAWRDAWQNFTRDLESSLTDALMRSFEAGDSAGEAFIKNLQNMIKTAALKLAVQVTVNTGLGMVQNAANGANILTGVGGTTGGGAMNLLSAGNSLYNLASGGGIMGSIGGFGAGAASMASELALGASFVGPSASLASGAVGMGASAAAATGSAGMAGAMSSLAAAAPTVAAALAVASIFGKSLFGSKKPAAIQWGYLDTDKNYDTNSNKWGVAEQGPFGGSLTFGQHLSRNGMSSEKLMGSVSRPLIALDKVVAQYLTGEETGRVSAKLQSVQHVERAWNQAEVDGVMMRRLNNISDAIGGWVDNLADTTTGNLQARYEQLAQILSLRGDPRMEKLAEGMLASTGTFQYERLAAFQVGMKQFSDLFGAGENKTDSISIALHEAFKKLNQAFPETRSGFRDLVNGVDAGTKAGFELYGTLLDLAPAMDTYYNSLQDELAVKKQLAAMNENHFATAVDYQRYQAVSTNFDPTFAGDYAYNIQRGAIKPGAAANDDMVVEIQALRSELQAANVAIATNTQDTAKLLRRWNGDGMPGTRVVA